MNNNNVFVHIAQKSWFSDAQMAVLNIDKNALCCCRGWLWFCIESKLWRCDWRCIFLPRKVMCVTFSLWLWCFSAAVAKNHGPNSQTILGQS